MISDRCLISCYKRHDDYFKLQFEKENDLQKLLYEKRYIEETMKIYEGQISIVDNKVKKTQINQDVTLYKGEIPQEFQEKIDVVESEIKRMIREMAILAEKGQAEEYDRLDNEVQNLQKTKADLLIVAVNPNLASKQMKICEVCGAKQSINDMEKRNLSHLEGKLHTGFQIIRTDYEKLKKRLEMVMIAIEVKTEEARRLGRNADNEISDFNKNYRDNRNDNSKPVVRPSSNMDLQKRDEYRFRNDPPTYRVNNGRGNRHGFGRERRHDEGFDRSRWRNDKFDSMFEGFKGAMPRHNNRDSDSRAENDRYRERDNDRNRDRPRNFDDRRDSRRDRGRDYEQSRSKYHDRSDDRRRDRNSSSEGEKHRRDRDEDRDHKRRRDDDRSDRVEDRDHKRRRDDDRSDRGEKKHKRHRDSSD